MNKNIELDAPNVSELEKEYLSRCIDSGFVSTFGPYVREFEEKFSRYLKVRNAVSTQSGTAALHMALYALGIGKGDEVIIPALTFVATANPVLYVGAKPVFADVDANTWNILPSEIERSITAKTRAIIPVHFYGNPCDMTEILKIARKYKLYVIEDATQSLGARYDKKHMGAFGDLGCFSFNGNKTITTGGGGMIVGNNMRILSRIRSLVNQARDASRGYYHTEVGFNYRMTNLEAALGMAQMKKLLDFLSRKRKFNKIYRKELSGVAGIRFQEGYDGAESSHWLTCIILEDRLPAQQLQKKLWKLKIPTRRVFVPLTEFPPYRKYKNSDYKNAYRIYDRGLCLPGSTLNSEEDTHYVCGKINEVVRSCIRSKKE